MMRLIAIILVVYWVYSVPEEVDAQLFRRWVVDDQSWTAGYQQEAEPTSRLPGPRHSTGTGCDCGMCVGIHLRGVHGVDLSGVGDWATYHDNLHNQKLLVYSPTPTVLVGHMVELLAPEPRELFLDLGSGDGRILIAAAKAGCDRVVGYELKPDLVKKSKAAAKKAGVHVTVNQESFLTLNLRTVSCVTVYLDEPMLRLVMPNLETLEAGARVVSYAHQLPGVPPQDVYVYPEGVLYAYSAPIRRE